jgi:hypothetical protein
MSHACIRTLFQERLDRIPNPYCRPASERLPTRIGHLKSFLRSQEFTLHQAGACSAV